MRKETENGAGEWKGVLLYKRWRGFLDEKSQMSLLLYEIPYSLPLILRVGALSHIRVGGKVGPLTRSKPRRAGTQLIIQPNPKMEPISQLKIVTVRLMIPWLFTPAVKWDGNVCFAPAAVLHTTLPYSCSSKARPNAFR